MSIKALLSVHVLASQFSTVAVQYYCIILPPNTDGVGAGHRLATQHTVLLQGGRGECSGNWTV